MMRSSASVNLLQPRVAGDGAYSMTEPADELRIVGCRLDSGTRVSTAQRTEPEGLRRLDARESAAVGDVARYAIASLSAYRTRQRQRRRDGPLATAVSSRSITAAETPGPRRHGRGGSRRRSGTPSAFATDCLAFDRRSGRPAGRGRGPAAATTIIITDEHTRTDGRVRSERIEAPAQHGLPPIRTSCLEAQASARRRRRRAARQRRSRTAGARSRS